MPVAEDILAGARKGRRADAEALLAEHYPLICRMARGLAGSDDYARGVLRFVMSHAMQNVQHWRDPDAVERWFVHQTVLTRRRTADRAPDPRADLLVGDASSDPPYVAFVRAVRTLSPQQREAFLLHHGERWTVRQVAVAMDCSTQATEMHLRLAQQSLTTVAGNDYSRLMNRLVATYASLTPSAQATLQTASRYAARNLLPSRIRRWSVAVLIGLILATIVWVVLKLRASGHL